MSWLQSSLGFAKTAINQAQKSIDKVLDIKEEHDVLSPGRSYSVVGRIDHGSSVPSLATVRRVGSLTCVRWLIIILLQ